MDNQQEKKAPAQRRKFTLIDDDPPEPCPKQPAKKARAATKAQPKQGRRLPSRAKAKPTIKNGGTPANFRRVKIKNDKSHLLALFARHDTELGQGDAKCPPSLAIDAPPAAVGRLARVALDLDEILFLRGTLGKLYPPDRFARSLRDYLVKRVLNVCQREHFACENCARDGRLSCDEARAIHEDAPTPEAAVVAVWQGRPDFEIFAARVSAVVRDDYCPTPIGCCPPEPPKGAPLAITLHAAFREAWDFPGDQRLVTQWLAKRAAGIDDPPDLPVVAGLLRVQQGSDTWLQARRRRITGSRVATVLGHNPYEPDWVDALHRDVFPDMLRDGRPLEPVVHSEDTLRNFAYGHENEPKARDAFVSEMRARPDILELEFLELGIYYPRNDDLSLFAFSPDGVVRLVHAGPEGQRSETWALVEFKCPAVARRPYRTMPAYYFDQVQLGMGVFGLPLCFFVVWTPDCGTTIERIEFVPGYFWNTLVPRAAARAAHVRGLLTAPPSSIAIKQ